MENNGIHDFSFFNTERPANNKKWVDLFHNIKVTYKWSKVQFGSFKHEDKLIV